MGIMYTLAVLAAFGMAGSALATDYEEDGKDMMTQAQYRTAIFAVG